MSYIKISKPRKNRLDKIVKLSVDITIFQNETVVYKQLWYEVDLTVDKYLYMNRIDPFVVAILPYCMKNSLDIKVDSETGISADLYYQLKEILIPSMSMAEKFNNIDLIASPIWKKLSSGEDIATGVSRGVDSFYTILKTMNGMYKPTLLTLFNVQAYGEYGGIAAHEMFGRDLKIAKKLCDDLNNQYETNITILTVESNIQEELPIKIYDAGSFRDAGAIILLKQLIKLYFFSTTILLRDFTVNGSCREFEPWLFSCLSTEIQKIQPIGADKKRLDKVRFISNYAITKNYLKVCREPLLYGTDGKSSEKDTNCTFNCEKCRGTVMELMAIGKLSDYNSVFDTKWVWEHKKELLYEVIANQNQSGELGYTDIYKLMRENGTINDFMEIEAGLYLETMDDAPLDRDYRILEIMNLFISKKQDGMMLKDVLKKSGYKKIGIYGMGRLGKILYHELGSMIKVEIDRNIQMQYGDVELRKPNEDFSDLDLIIITTVYKEEMLKKYLLSKESCEVITLKELLFLI